MPPNHDLQTIVTIIQAVSTIVFGVFGWFARRTLTKIDSDIAKNSEQIESLAKLHLEIGLTKKELEYIANDVRAVRSIGEDVAVLKRDQKSIWQRIDELRTKLDTISESIRINNRRGK